MAATALALCILAAPAAAAVVSKGQKNFKRGVEHEAAKQWEKAVEEFALAVAAEPSNAEYQLHYRRAVFNASQLFMQQGSSHVERGDYISAYNAFRRAYAYDQSNELARSMTERMLRLQLEKEGVGGGTNGQTEHSVSRTSYADGSAVAAQPRREQQQQQQAESLPGARGEQLRVITYSGDLEGFIKYLARQLRLNAIFDRDFPQRELSVDLIDVTAAQALDYVFLTQGLFFQKVSNRTILVAEQTKRPQYQQLVLRTFYLSNIEPNDAKALIQASIPPQAGRQPVITANKATNSITVRDTVENVRLVSDLLRSVDKDRAEVVMDVQIFEVSRTDLMQLGNQIGGEGSLTNLGGIQKGLSVIGGSSQVVTQALAATPTALGAALVIPATAFSAFQRKDNTRLIASTQVHAFDGEKSTAHIGQRVPVQTATVTPYGAVSTGENNAQPGTATNLFGGNGYPVIQYEKTGLTLEFTPQVSPTLDVQVKMSIKSNDISTAAGTTLTPTFTERNIEGTARIQNNRTMMIASVAQNQQTRGRQGLPLLGLMPVLGRFFTAPRRNDQQTDIVIAVTPHVLRAPSYSDSDEVMRPSGTMTTPNSDSLEAMLHQVERDEKLAAARMLPRHAEVQIRESGQPATEPARPTAQPVEQTARVERQAAPSEQTTNVEQTTFVPAPKALMNVAAEAEVHASSNESPVPVAVDSAPAAAPRPRRVEASYERPANTAAYNFTGSLGLGAAKPERAAPATHESAAPSPSEVTAPASAQPSAAPLPAPRSAAQLMLMPEPQRLSVGERRLLKLVLKTDAPLGMIASSLRFDPRVAAVRSVTLGNMFGDASARPTLSHSVSADGVLLFTLTPAAGSPPLTGAGVMLCVEVEALAPGSTDFLFAAEDVHLMATDGRRVLVKVLPGSVAVKQ